MNSAGNILEEYNYDPCLPVRSGAKAGGRRRNPADWSYSNVSEPTYTNRGFTGHEHLDIFNLIDMLSAAKSRQRSSSGNGRIYDSEIARFLSPDPIIQDPYNILNYNRYSYCMNNPLKYTDPSGYSYQKFLQEYLKDKDTYGQAQFFNNYPEGWAQMQESNYRGAWQYYVSSSYITDGSSPQFGKRGNEIGYWVKTSNYTTNSYQGNIHSLNDIGSVGISLEFIALPNSSFEIPQSEGVNNVDPSIQKGNKIIGLIGVAVDATKEFLTNTKAGSDLAYKMAYSTTLVKGANCLKPFGYGLTGLSFASDIYLSSSINPSTSERYQSWGETGMNTAVTIGSTIVGGWLGITIQLDYHFSKAYMNTIMAHPDWAPYPNRGFNH